MAITKWLGLESYRGSKRSVELDKIHIFRHAESYGPISTSATNMARDGQGGGAAEHGDAGARESCLDGRGDLGYHSRCANTAQGRSLERTAQYGEKRAEGDGKRDGQEEGQGR